MASGFLPPVPNLEDPISSNLISPEPSTPGGVDRCPAGRPKDDRDYFIVTRLRGFTLEREEIPIRVQEAAQFLGVSPQTVYLWVERKQIPHLRVMGRNIRFLKSELELLPRAVQTGGGEWAGQQA